MKQHIKHQQVFIVENHRKIYWNLLKVAISEFQKLKTRLNAKPFLAKEFYLHENLNHFHISCNTFVLNFTLKQTLGNSQIRLATSRPFIRS